MFRGLYTSTAGMLAGVTRQESIVHNLANMRTIGYKSDRVSMTDFPSLLLTQIRDGEQGPEVGRLGTGITKAAIVGDFQDGPISLTDHLYDFAVAGEGFFQVQTPDGVRYTRDGRFHIDENGSLLSENGYPVLGANGPIVLPQGELTVSQTGTVYVNGAEVAQFSLVRFDDLTGLVKDDQTNFSAPGGGAQVIPVAQTKIYQGYLEGSNVDVAQMATEMTTVMRAYQFSQQMVQMQDRINAKSVSQLGAV